MRTLVFQQMHFLNTEITPSSLYCRMKTNDSLLSIENLKPIHGKKAKPANSPLGTASQAPQRHR